MLFAHQIIVGNLAGPGACMGEEHPQPDQGEWEPPEIEQAPSLIELRAELARTQRAWMAAEEGLRETLAAMIQHQQVGKCGNFRYNTVTGAITGTEEVFKMFRFPPGTRGCTVEQWLERLHPDDRARIEQQFFAAIAGGKDLRFEYRIVLDTGEKHIRCDGEPDLEFKGELVYFGVLTDVTERRAAEQAQRTMEAELAAALRLASMGELAGSIIHEVNQPLAAIATSASACRRWMAAGEDHKERALASLDRVVEEGQRAAAIISGLKSLIHDVSAEPSAFDWEGAARDVCSLILSELARENILLETRFAADLPRAVGNRVQFQQILMNLARNAIEAMQNSKARRVLTVATARRDAMLSLQVADTGTGFDGANPDLLFKPLFTTKKEGMGLGLSISRKIAIAHGGTLHAAAREGGGSVFELLLPAEGGDHV
ncbi:sensor histidine kinase [Sphingosinicella sp. BN140058]|uniref:sensor histidine kinase n=1 Tax=Sphingosinicella sp. BN140058 TaxID=1892855 RepID=UPI0010124406|nr:ATP-binding protein [Sphingosinicella sp. BN140058]QAY76342.1 GHKL domain-containing protein [Sphingosinicella sp. BN140058]